MKKKKKKFRKLIDYQFEDENEKNKQVKKECKECYIYPGCMGEIRE